MATAAALNHPLDDPTTGMRTAMVAELQEIGAIATEPVAAAFAAVPRHQFAPDAALTAAYRASEAVLAKRDADGVATSWVSAPSVQAQMLEQLDAAPGMRVLEIGSGGYNAALIAEIVGPGGHVVSVDIDPDITTRAEAFLAAAGYAHRVRVVKADAEFPLADEAPFDRIIVTVGAWDIPPSWADQLAPGGRLLAPLRMRGLTRTVAFEKVGDHLVSRSYRLAAFVPMQGQGQYDKQLIEVDPGVAVWVDEPDQVVDAAAVREALHCDPVRVWPGIPFDLPDESELYIATSGPAVAVLHGTKDVVDSGLLAPSALRGVPALLSGDGRSFAYRTKRVVDGAGPEGEFGTIGHGPDGPALAEQLARIIAEWSRDFLYRDAATITVYPRSTPEADLPAGLVMTKRHSHVVVSWQRPRTS